jgi:hypothetical protein
MRFEMTKPVSQSSGIRISGFEDLDTDVVDGKWRDLDKLLASRKGPLRIDRVLSGGPFDAPHIYLRERSWGEFFYERLIARPKELADIENEARAAIAHALDPYINMCLCLQQQPAVPRLDARDKENLRFDRLRMQGLQAAVLESGPALRSLRDEQIGAMSPLEFARRVELMPVNGLRKVPPGLSVLPFSPLTLICDCVFAGSAVPKCSDYSEGNAFDRARKAFEKALSELRRPAVEAALTISDDQDAEQGKALSDPDYVTELKTHPGLKHVEHLYLVDESAIRDSRQLKKAGFDVVHAAADGWLDFYSRILVQAARIHPFGSTVLEPCPSHWMNQRGVSKPVYTDENIQGLALAALSMRDAGLKTGATFQSITLAIPDAELRARVEQALLKQESGLFKSSAASAMQHWMRQQVFADGTEDSSSDSDLLEDEDEE